MAKLEDILAKADKLIRDEKYDAAWKFLLPYRDEEEVLSRLKFVATKRKSLTSEQSTVKRATWQNLPNYAKAVIVSIFLICGFLFLVTMFNSGTNSSSDTIIESTSQNLSLLETLSMTPFTSERTGYVIVAAISQDCPQAGCNRVNVYQGEYLPVYGIVEGEMREGSNLWYVVLRNNELVYIHINSLNFSGPTPIIPTYDASQDIGRPVNPPPSNSGGASRGSSGSSNNSNYPENCAEAVEMGLTAEQAGRYSHLDRDGDGVACYGD